MQHKSFYWTKTDSSGARLWTNKAGSVQQITGEIQCLDQRKKSASESEQWTQQHDKKGGRREGQIENEAKR